MSDLLKVATDCSGVGAPEEALKSIGIEHRVVFACEIDKYARKTYLANHTCETMFEDITKRDNSGIEQADLYVAGFPCQAFSIAGKRGGFDDTRGTIFFNCADFIRQNRPRFFILENVKGLLSIKADKTISNSLFLLLSKFNDIKWQSQNTLNSNLTSLSQELATYLLLKLESSSELRKQELDTCLLRNSELSFEALGQKVRHGLITKFESLVEVICRITKKSKCYQEGQMGQSECKEEEWDSSQYQLGLMECSNLMVINLLEKTKNTKESIGLFQKGSSEENLKREKWFTILTEINSTITNQTFLYAVEANIIRLIILALDLSPLLWKEAWLILTKKKKFIGLKTFDVILFYLKATGYQIHFKVLNTLNFGIPQNRERIFIVGLRDAEDSFSFPDRVPLRLRLRDLWEKEVDEKYYLSETAVARLKGIKQEGTAHVEPGLYRWQNKTSGIIKDEVCPTIRSSGGTDIRKKPVFVSDETPCAITNNKGVIGVNTIVNCIDANYAKGMDNHSQRSVVMQLNPSTESGGVQPYQQNRIYDPEGICPAVLSEMSCGTHAIVDPKIIQRGRGKNKGGEHEECPTITSNHFEQNNDVLAHSRIRRLTPRECFRLQGFSDTFDISQVSDTQAYKQAGNSMTVHVIEAIIRKLLPNLQNSIL